MPMDTQQILTAIEEAVTGGGHIIIRFSWGQMRTLIPDEADQLLAVLKANNAAPQYVNSQGWHLCEDNVVDGLAFYDPGEEVTLYCMVKGDVYEYTVTLPTISNSESNNGGADRT